MIVLSLVGNCKIAYECSTGIACSERDAHNEFHKNPSVSSKVIIRGIHANMMILISLSCNLIRIIRLERCSPDRGIQFPHAFFEPRHYEWSSLFQ
jgi:hypothetical protein